MEISDIIARVTQLSWTLRQLPICPPGVATPNTVCQGDDPRLASAPNVQLWE